MTHDNRWAGGQPSGPTATSARSVGLALAALVAVGGQVGAQTLAERAQVRNGDVRFSYATRPEVCGMGRNVHTVRATDDWESDWEGDCAHGPARVVLEWRDGALVDVDTYVGGRWRPAASGVVDLGTVSAPAAATMLLDLAGRVDGKAGDDLIFPATLADSVEVWPRLVSLARDDEVPRATRKNAVFWLGQAAGDRAIADLGGFVADENEDREIQEQAVFALSQLRDGGGVPSLLEIAQTHRDPKIRKTALFWLGQSNDPRAVALFEEILRR
jgi:hypothetical protein